MLPTMKSISQNTCFFEKKTQANSGKVRNNRFGISEKKLIHHKLCYQNDNFEKKNLEKNFSKKFASEIRKKKCQKKN